jgi:hypothetical protein
MHYQTNHKFSILIAINCEANNQKALIGPSVWGPQIYCKKSFDHKIFFELKGNRIKCENDAKLLGVTIDYELKLA